jgi:hypothetical protein
MSLMAVVEVTAFTLSGDEQAFRVVDARMQTDFAYQQAGLLRRTTARGDDGQWLVLTMWSDDASADVAARNALDDDVAREFASYAKPKSMRTKRFTLLE